MSLSISQLKVLQTNQEDDKPQLRGFKKTQKEFRRNILLKKKINTQKFNKSQTIFNTSTASTIKILRPEQTSGSHYDRGYQDRNSLSQNLTCTAKQSYNRSLHINTEILDKRMEQYLSVVFKKVEIDTDKIMRVFEQNLDKKGKKKELPFTNPNFIKRLKINSIKMRLRRQRQNSKLKQQGPSSLKLQQAQSFISKLTKTQTSVSPKKNRKPHYDDKYTKSSMNVSCQDQLRRRTCTSMENFQFPKKHP